VHFPDVVLFNTKAVSCWSVRRRRFDLLACVSSSSCHRRGPSFVITGPYSLSSGRGSSFVVWSSFAVGPTCSRCTTHAWSLGLRFLRWSLLVFGLGGGVFVVVHYAGGLWDGMSREWRRTTMNGMARVFMMHLMGFLLLGPPFHCSPSPTLPLEKYKPAHIPLERGGG